MRDAREHRETLGRKAREYSIVRDTRRSAALCRTLVKTKCSWVQNAWLRSVAGCKTLVNVAGCKTFGFECCCRQRAFGVADARRALIHYLYLVD